MNFRRTLLIASGILIFLVAAAITLIDVLFLRNMRQNAEQVLSHAFSAPVGIRLLSIDLLRGLAVRGISISNSGHPCVSVDEIFVRVDPAELFRRGLAIKDISGNGIAILVSDSTNDYLPFYQSLVSKFTNHPVRKTSVFHINLEKAELRNVQISIKEKKFKVDRFTFESPGTIKKFDVEVKDFAGILRFKLQSSLSNRTWNATADYGFLDDKILNTITSGRIAAIITNFRSFVVTNFSTGPGLEVKMRALIEPAAERIRVFDNQGFLTYRDNVMTFSGGLQGFRQFNYEIKGSSESTGFNPRILSTNLSGNIRFQADVNGSFRDKTFNINSGRLASDDLSLKGVFTNTIHVRNIDAPFSGNRITKGSCLVELAGGTHKIAFSTGDLFSHPLKTDIKVRSDIFEVHSVRLLSRNKKGTNNGFTDYEANLSFECGNLKIGNESLEDVHLSGSVAGGNISDGKFSGLFKNAAIKCSFESKGPDVSGELSFRNFNAGAYVTGLSTDLSGELKAHFEGRSRTLSGMGTIHGNRVGFMGFEMGDLESTVSMASNRFFLENGKASFYQGELTFSGSYDSRLKGLSADVKGNGLDIETFISAYKPSSALLKTFLPSESSTVSGTAECEAHLKTVQTSDPLMSLELSAKVTIKKGIVKDTLVQKQYSGVLGDVINYLQYENGNLNFTVKNGILKAENLDLVSDEMELHMTLDQDLKTGIRNSERKLMLSQDFVDQLNNPAQLPLTIISYQEKNWRVCRQIEDKNKVRFVK